MFHAGQRVVTSHGCTVTVAMVGDNGKVYAYTGRALPEVVTPRYDAFGGEHCQSEGLQPIRH